MLSASHCFSDLPPTITSITFTLDETIDQDRDGVIDADVTLLSGTPVTHPLYGHRANNPYDIAVFLLDAPVTNVAPAPLAPAGMLDRAGLRDETFTAVGYGTVRAASDRDRKVSRSDGGVRRPTSSCSPSPRPGRPSP